MLDVLGLFNANPLPFFLCMPLLQRSCFTCLDAIILLVGLCCLNDVFLSVENLNLGPFERRASSDLL